MPSDEPAKRARPGRVALLRTAIALMGEQGYEGTSTRDIAAAAGVSVAALYYHFPAKIDMLREFMYESHDIVAARVERYVGAAGPSAVERLEAAVGALVWSNLHDDFSRLATRVAWREHGRLSEEDERAIAAKRELVVAVLERTIAEGIESGEFATDDAGAAARAVLALCMAVVDPAPGTTPLEQVVELHQRFAVALANTPPPTGAGRSDTRADPAPTTRGGRGLRHPV